MLAQDTAQIILRVHALRIELEKQRHRMIDEIGPCLEACPQDYASVERTRAALRDCARQLNQFTAMVDELMEATILFSMNLKDPWLIPAAFPPSTMPSTVNTQAGPMNVQDIVATLVESIDWVLDKLDQVASSVRAKSEAEANLSKEG